MKKDKTILLLIDKLKLLENFKLVEIVDYWDGDLCAIGIRRKNKLVYISTFNSVNEDVVVYDYDLEFINNELKLDKIDVVKRGRGISENETLREVQSFLNL